VSEWLDNQRKPSSSIRQLVQERIDKANPRRELNTEETKRLNKFGVWQFRMWISSEKKYVEKSLRTKKKTDAVDLAEELYINL